METFRIIALTADTEIPGEAHIIRELFREGMDTLHLRKTRYAPEQLRAFLDKIPPEYCSRIVLHSHFALLDEYPLKGLHLNSRFPGYTGTKALHRSKSLHTLQDLAGNREYDYVFISPVFASISKPEHQAAHNRAELEEALQKRKEAGPASVIGLGGVTESSIGSLKSMGLDGAAILGYLWGEGKEEKILERFKKIRDTALER